MQATWLLLTAEYLFLMMGGTDQYLKRQPRAGKSYRLPETWYRDTQLAPPGTIIEDLNKTDVRSYGSTPADPPSITLEEPVRLPPPPSTPAYLRFEPTKKLENGLIVFNLLGIDGGKIKEWAMHSGTRGAQTLDRPERDWPGSNRPIPHGLYKIGPVEVAPRGDWGPGLGPYWISLDPVRPVNKRASIGLHQDSNYQTAPGSAGCVVNSSLNVIKEICSWVETNKARYLLVDYGYGVDWEPGKINDG